MSTLAFTICSINYLAQARTLGESLAATNPDVRFVVGLVDRLDGIRFDAETRPDVELLEVHRIGIPDFAAMCARYDITELNTAVKPFFFEYFFQHAPEAERLIYFDPDIIVFQPLTHLVDGLNRCDVLVTPHALSPFPDEFYPAENDFMNTGTFNLGFIALRRSDEARRMVRWWMEKLRDECRIDLCHGLFVDQKWINLVPHFFRNVGIEKHPGYNVAYWNLHERHLANVEGTWLVNERYPLQFFHFSGYGLKQPDSISKYQTRFTFAQRSDVVPLFARYAERLRAHHNETYARYPCAYIKPPKVIRLKRVRKALRTPFATLADWLEKRHAGS
jgi:hypothetical protein